MSGLEGRGGEGEEKTSLDGGKEGREGGEELLKKMYARVCNFSPYRYRKRVGKFYSPAVLIVSCGSVQKRR